MKIYYKQLRKHELDGVGFCDEQIFQLKKSKLENEGLKVVILTKEEFNKLCNEGF